MAKSQKRKSSKKKSKVKSYGKNDKIVIIGLVIDIAIFAIIVYKILDVLIFSEENYDLSGGNYYQYFYGIMEEYSGDMQVILNDDNIQLILENNQVIYLDSTPIYYRDVLGKVLFAQEMEIVIPDVGNYKLSKFTNILEENNTMYVKNYNDDNTTALDNAFLYDGSDLYFFLQETTVTVGNQEYELSPLSYVIVNYRENVEIYDYERDEYTIIQDEELLMSDVIAVNNINDYTINMSLDSLTTTKNQLLLIKTISNLTEFEY